MQLRRSSGILLHPTSLPGGCGVGDLGESARRFVDRLAEGQQRWWQILPLNPPDYMGSPYSAISSMAMNPTLVDLQALVDKGWLEQRELPADAEGPVDFAAVVTAKDSALRAAFGRATLDDPAFAAFCEAQAEWLEDWALFAALRVEHGGDWRRWPEGIVRREPEALREASASLADEVRYARFAQWVVNEQWVELRAYAAERDVRVIGDVPIFVAMDSADVWANRDIFEVDDVGSASVVAGVPPDYFSPTGQKWGNPLYRWDRLSETDYAWWKQRISRVREQCDIVRIDHFRGFESYWEVPEEAPTAETGVWRSGPGIAFFDWVRQTFDEVPFIAEDLGMITNAVHELRDATGLPGMKILQFAFDGNPNHPFLPHTYPENCVAYTGTHDNDTTLGWWQSTDEKTRHHARVYLSHGNDGIVWALIEALLGSDANLTIVPLQDLFELDASARMNSPGTSTTANWSWRMTNEQLAAHEPWTRLSTLVDLYGR